MKRKKISYICKVNSTGKVVGPSAEMIRPDLIKHFSGKFVTITVEGYENPHTDQARGYYHAVVVPLLIEGLINAGHDIDKTDKDQVRDARKSIEEMLIQAAEEIEQITETNVKGDIVSYWPDMKDLPSIEYWMIIDDMITFMKTFLGIREVPKPKKK